MQPAGVNALAAIGNAAPPAQSGGASSIEDGDASPAGQQFAQMLHDSGGHAEDQQGQQQFTRGHLISAVATGAIAAQEVKEAAKDGQLADLFTGGEELLTPQDATQMIQRIDEMLQHGESISPQEMAALAQLKEQFQQVEKGGQPKALAEIMAAVPGVQEAPKLLKPLMGFFTSLKRARNEHAESEVPDHLQPMQNVPANFFRTARGTHPATTPAEKRKEEKTESVDAKLAETLMRPSVIDPIVYASHVPVMPVTVSADNEQMAAALVATGAPVIASQPSLSPRTDLDDAIPELKLDMSAPENLPKIELPKMAQQPVSEPQKLEAASKPQELIPVKAGLVEHTQPVDAPVVADNTGNPLLTNVMNPSHTNGHSPTQTLQAPQPASAVPQHYGSLNQAPVAEQVHVAIHEAAKDGTSRITIQLDPVDLGRVEVNMHTGADGHTRISFMVDKAETFDSLSRDARMLERSLQEAGIKADTSGMQFNLRQQPQQQLHSDLNGQGGQNQHAQFEQDANEPNGITSIASVAALTRNYTINIREGVDISA